MNRDIKRAIALYESFREKRPKKISSVSVRVPHAVAVIGHVDTIDYTTTHGEKVTSYRHPFAPGSRPLLCVSGDGRQLMLLGGRYKFTERGIVDRDHKGREVESPAHGKALKGNPKSNGWVYSSASKRWRWNSPRLGPVMATKAAGRWYLMTEPHSGNPAVLGTHDTKEGAFAAAI